MPEEEIIPNGVILDFPESDFVNGDGNLGAIADRILLPSGDYTSYAPKGEKQKQNGFETNNCTAFSYTNVVETQFNVLKAQGVISVGTMQFLSDNGYLKDGELQLSDRALGAWAGTSQSGNSLSKVAFTGYKMGLIPESKWPSVWTNYTDYYRKDMPQALYDLGLEFLKHFSLPYEQVVTQSLEDALKAAPLYVALKTCSPWNSPPVKWCGIVDTNHAVELLKKSNYRVFDSYEPFVKDLAAEYVIPYFYKVLLITADMPNQTKIVLSKDGKTVYKAVPIATDFENFKKQAGVEGIVVPNPIPPASTL